jgi:hypothetical protein
MQRLALLVRSRDDGSWGFPGGVRLDGEPMLQVRRVRWDPTRAGTSGIGYLQAAERCMRQIWNGGSDTPLDLWYVGNAPVGHWLQVRSIL